MLLPFLICALALALLAIVALSLALVRYIGLGTLWRGLRGALPGRARSFEYAYLRAIDHRLGSTPALLVISGVEASRRDLNLLEAFSPIALRQEIGEPIREDDQAEPDERTSVPVALAEHHFVPRRWLPDGHETMREPWLRQRASYIALWLLTQTPPLALALAVCVGLLRSPAGGWLLTWPRIGGATAVTIIWLLFARWLHTWLVGDDKLDELLERWARRRQCVADPGTPGAEIWQHPRLLIRGDPGSGKTTLLRHMAVICARDWLGLAQRRNAERVRDAYGWPARPFPIYIPLRALSFAAQGARPLLESYVETLPALFGPELRACTPGFFARRVRKGGCLILLDAFDELPSADARQQLGRLVADLPPGPPRNPNRIVVTSRVVGYEGQLDGAGFVHRHVAELDDDQVANFIAARYLAIAATERRSLGLPADARLRWNPHERAGVLGRRLPENPGLRRLSRNPLLLALAVAVHHDQRGKGQDLPQERYRLYEEALRLLVYDWEQRKEVDIGREPGGEVGDLNVDEKLRLLRELAWAMFEQAPSGADRRAHAVITGSQARAVLARTLEQIPGFAPDQTGAARAGYCRAEVARVLQRLNQRGGVLQELGNLPGTNDAQIQFAHLTFQEYLAARAAASEQQEQRRERLLQRWDDPRWREVLLLYAASAAATPIVAHLLEQTGVESRLLAGAVLLERPISLDQRCQTATIAALRTIALDDHQVGEETALKALDLLRETNALPERPALLPAVELTAYAGVRTQLIGMLAEMPVNQIGVPLERVGSNRDASRGRPPRPKAAPSRPTVPPRPTPATLTPDIQEALLRVLEREQAYQPRIAAGFALARHDPRYDGDGWIPELVAVPADPFLMGSRDEDQQADSDEKPQHPVDLPYSYFIGKTPVTVAQWRCFIKAGGYETERFWTEAGWRFIQMLPEGMDEEVGRSEWWARLSRRRQPTRLPAYHPRLWHGPEHGDDNMPVVNVSWHEAVAYCRWLSAASGQAFYLPSEAEWEKAARGPHGLIYPWGDEWQPGCCNSREAGIGRRTPVGSFPAGASVYGALDMAGNIWEWCATKSGKEYPYRLEDEWNEDYLEDYAPRRIRGGSFWDEQRRVRGASRGSYNPRHRSTSSSGCGSPVVLPVLMLNPDF